MTTPPHKSAFLGGNKARGRVIIFSGPSGAGKTTLYRMVLEDDIFKKLIVRSVSVTTRRPRAGEKEGVDYFFITKKMFMYKKRANQLLESALVVGNFYGTPRKWVQDVLRTGRNVLLCIDVQGAKSVAKQYQNALKIFIAPPSLDVLISRLTKRGTESVEHLKVRLATAEKELRLVTRYDYVIENDNLAVAYQQVREILKNEIS